MKPKPDSQLADVNRAFEKFRNALVDFVNVCIRNGHPIRLISFQDNRDVINGQTKCSVTYRKVRK